MKNNLFFFKSKLLAFFILFSINALSQDIEQRILKYSQDDVKDVESIIKISPDQKEVLLSFFKDKYYKYQKAPSSLEENTNRINYLKSRIKEILSNDQFTSLEKNQNKLYDLFSTRKFLYNL